MKGSEWSKWDLHIHSPMTWMASTFKGPEDIPEFIKKLGESRISLIGLTNYFFLAENEIEIIHEEIDRQGLNITVLPNVEFRLAQPNKQGDWINIHCLFSEKIPTAKINQVLSNLTIATKSAAGRPVYCSELSLKESGKSIGEITVNFEDLCKHISSHFELFREAIIAVCPNGYGGYRPNGEGRSKEVATQIDREGHIILDSSQNSLPVREFFLMTDRYPGANKKPVFRCSDAHGLEKTGTLFSWVKAMPTFEGLRQTLLEPDARLKLEVDWPRQRAAKVHFSRIEVEGTIFDGQKIRFKKLSIPLNEDMVAIIGGRGTGKSLILDGLQSRFTPSRPENVRARSVSPQRLSVQLSKTDGEFKEFDGIDNSYSYLHVSQGEIKDLCQEPEKISDEIKKMLRLPPQSFPVPLRNELESNLNEFRSLFSFFNMKNEKGQFINREEYHTSTISAVQKHIDTLTSEKNRELIKIFQENGKSLSDINSQLNWLNDFLKQLSDKESELNNQIDFINAKRAEEHVIPHVNFEPQRGVINNKIILAKSESEIKGAINHDIIHQFRQQGIEQDISGLLDKVTEYQQMINRAELEREESQRRLGLGKKNLDNRKELINRVLSHIRQEKETVDAAFNALTEAKEHYTADQQTLVAEILQEIGIYGEVTFDRDTFYAGALRCMNGGKFRASREGETQTDKIAALFNVHTVEDYTRLVSNENILKVQDDKQTMTDISLNNLLCKQEYFNSAGPHDLLAHLFSPDRISAYLGVKAQFTYKGKTVEKLSAGQRGTFYVCLKLATDPFGSPFVFDQPEDDLDNDFIMHHLVPLFRKIKQYRQVIIVTHNANLVVNCDAEQVLVASNNDEVITYRCGALEAGELAHGNTMRQAICNVLEGGHLAFEQRERKYGLLRPAL
ncbi:TrlF family AAA-like ATPase [Xenorhabdus bovienii]|uniref:ATPase involved in DNA repair n=1 Tax=Xenorhabdus bovienii str. kraussei Becker Underwood TaxID=1398204 RepID=A0A077PIA2_XENBV|nr:ATPase involved in DNA repair [Xenorhabdus bovienii str. kraussei Becker Underwood]